MNARPWWNDPLPVLDFETTGTDPAEARIVQAAFYLVSASGGLLPGSLVGLVDPGVPIPESAAAVHGITDEQVKAHGCPPAEVVYDIVRRVDRICERGWPLTIYNVPFDWRLLLAECGRHDVERPQEPDFVDPLVLDHALDKYRKGSRRLADVCAHYGVKLEAAHDAGADARATAELARAIASRHSRIGGLSPAGLTTWQRRAYVAWQQDFNAYQKSKGSDVWAREGWPA